MKQSQVRKTGVPVAKRRVMRSSEMTTGIPKGMASQTEQTRTSTRKGDLSMEAKTGFTGFTGFDPKNVSENLLKMWKYSLDTTFESLAKVQEFNGKIIKDTITTGKQIQADAEKIVLDWSENSKKGLDEYRKIAEKGFKQAEELIQPAK